jgi:hypothetical protein
MSRCAFSVLNADTVQIPTNDRTPAVFRWVEVHGGQFVSTPYPRATAKCTDGLGATYCCCRYAVGVGCRIDCCAVKQHVGK